jgi:hypothetical protein
MTAIGSVKEGKPYRECLIPAKTVNRLAANKIDREEDDYCHPIEPGHMEILARIKAFHTT